MKKRPLPHPATKPARAAAAPKAIAVETDNAAMLFELSRTSAGDRLFLRHFGARVADTAGALALAGHGGHPSALGSEKPLAYSVFGESGGGLNRFGGLKVTHDDGMQTLDLVVEKLERRAGGLVVRWRDAAHDFRVEQTFRPRPDADVIETSAVLENGEKGPVRISRMASFSLVFPLLADDWRLLSLAGEWGGEAEVVETPLARGRRVVLESRSGVRDAWLNNPAFMLSVGGPATETEGRVDGAGIDVGDAGVGVSHHGHDPVQDDGDDGISLPDADERDQKPDKRDGRDRVKHITDRHDRLRKTAVFRNKNPEKHAQNAGDQDSDQGDLQLLPDQLQKPGPAADIDLQYFFKKTHNLR